MKLQVSSAVVASLHAEYASHAPHECCGLLFGHAGQVTALQPAANVHPAPRTHFEIDPRALITAHRAARTGGPQIAGYYHSHPGGPACPSSTDRAQAPGDGKIWAIIGQSELCFWRDTAEGFIALSYGVEDS